MKLRMILIILALLAFLSASIGGYFYYSSLQEAAFREAKRQAVSNAETIKTHISSFLYENLKSVRALAGLEELQQALTRKDNNAIFRANAILDHFNNALRVDVCYLMDRDGKTIASSNRDESDSFVGKNYAFRPYFRRAIHGNTSIYMALGVTSKKRGIYYSHPVYGKEEREPLGVAVIKTTIKPMEKEFSHVDEAIMLTDPHGVIFVTNRKEWLYHLVWKLPPEEISWIARSRQFGKGPWPWIGLNKEKGTRAFDQSGNEYLIHKMAIKNYPGWNLIYLTNLHVFFERVSDPLIKISGYLILVLCFFIGLSVFILYRKASYEILQRVRAEEALRESEKTALALLNAPTDNALLLDIKGTILALNEPAAHALGKNIKELIRACIFDFFHTDVAKREKARLNDVIRSGRPLRYEDKRGGRYFDTNLYPIFDIKSKVVRVAIFSRDVTEQKRAEEQLRQAKEDLSRYSKDLERQVTERTKEITSILENTPAVVFIKDSSYQYIMVNSRFEELFGIRNDEIHGKTDYDVFPKETADQFRASDFRVISERRSFQVEERVSQEDGEHTYLSMKFPLYDEHGSVRRLCGIATDITTIKKAQDQLRRVSSNIMASQEKERTAIARELHDELGQMLTALHMDSVWIRDHLREKDPEAGERALTMCSLIDKTIDEVQGMATRLRPGVLDDLGLIDALEWYTSDFEKRTGIACIFKHFSSPNIKDMLATASYRIAQEALTNVARHSFATHVDVSLQADNGVLTLSIVDNGGGFNTDELSDSTCLGIAGMRERASLVGGTLDIQSQLGKGAHVYFRVSMDSEKPSV